VYIGTSFDEPLPTAFLDDALQGTTPLLWMYHNIWQLTGHSATFENAYGWMWWRFDTSPVARVRYKGHAFTRYSANTSGIMEYRAVDPRKATVLADAVRSDGTTFPWAIRSRNLTYIGELPASYANETDRLIIFHDLLFDLLAPSTPARHRAMVRIEDVGPDSDPKTLRAMAGLLKARGIPFSVALYSHWKDPLHHRNYPAPVGADAPLSHVPKVVSALNDMVASGGTLLMHGWTHQLKTITNPYTGASGDDFEFWTAHIDDQNYVIEDGPVPGDSREWARNRVVSAMNEFKNAHLPVPKIWVTPHYAASVLDYQGFLAARMKVRYERTQFYGGTLNGGPVDQTQVFGQYFPYVVTDVYGSRVLPENLGNYEPVEENHNPPRLPADIIRAARLNLAVRDGFASFFFHWYYDLEVLGEIIDGILALGYTFVSPSSLLPSSSASTDDGTTRRERAIGRPVARAGASRSRSPRRPGR
jgi:uncharacterized protein YdaL